METDPETRSPSSLSLAERRRRPLSDATNAVVPVSSALRKLSDFLSAGPPLKPKPKPYTSSGSKTGANSSKSDTSIGSSSYNENVANPNSAPRLQPSTPPCISTSNFGNGSEDAFENIAIYSRKQTAEKTKNKEKAAAIPFGSCLRKTRNNAKADKLSFPGSLVEKAREKEVKRDKRKAIAIPPLISSSGATKNKVKAVSDPVDGSLLVNKRSKTKAAAAPFSCPPMSKSMKICDEIIEAGDNDPTNSCTVANRRHKKERYKLSLEQEFTDQQRAYFKEIDEFELPEEEVSEDELN